MSGGYRRLEHTADLRLLVYGSSLEALFEAAGRGLLHLMGKGGSAGERRPVTMAAADHESLLVAWLNELIYLAATAGGPPAACGITALRRDGGVRLEGWVGAASRWRPGQAEVKAATYHGLAVRDPSAAAPPAVPPGSWWAEVLLDV